MVFIEDSSRDDCFQRIIVFIVQFTFFARWFPTPRTLEQPPRTSVPLSVSSSLSSFFLLSFFLLANHHLCLWSLGPMVTDHETHEQEIGNDRNLWKKFKRVWVSLLAVDVPHSPSTWKRSNLEEEITLSPIFAANTIIIGNINTCSAFQTLFPSCLIV